MQNIVVSLINGVPVLQWQRNCLCNDLMGFHTCGRFALLPPVTQEARDELQLTKDQLETRGQELEACRQQGAELEIRLGTVQVIP